MNLILEEFHKLASGAFQELQDTLEEAIVATLTSAKITDRGVDLGDALKAPASTWTYLVDDNPFGNKLESLLVGSRNIGMAVGGTFLLGPLLLGLGVYRRLFSRFRDGTRGR